MSRGLSRYQIGRNPADTTVGVVSWKTLSKIVLIDVQTRNNNEGSGGF